MAKATRDSSWEDRFRHANDDDPEIQAHGKYFNCSYMLDMGEHRVIVKMSEGKVQQLHLDPGDLEVPYEFAIRASPDVWRKFAVKIPEPMFHGIWAASFRRGMKLEGNLLAMMQNLRCLTRQIELLRTTGVPV